MESIQNNCQKQRLQCFAHTLQLVVQDGLKETNVLNHSVAKLTKFCSLLHSSCGLKEAFEVEYGGNRSIPSATSVRWNTTLRLVEAVTQLDGQKLCTLLENQGHKELCLTPREMSQLKELVEVLGPFLQVTDLTQGEKLVTISAALLCVLSFNSHLNRMLTSVRHLTGLVKVLQRSLKHCFKGMFVNVGMEESGEHPEGYPFAETLYVVSALMDPNFCLFWLDYDVLVLFT